MCTTVVLIWTKVITLIKEVVKTDCNYMLTTFSSSINLWIWTSHVTSKENIKPSSLCIIYRDLLWVLFFQLRQLGWKVHIKENANLRPFALSRTGAQWIFIYLGYPTTCTGQNMFHNINGGEVKVWRFLEKLDIIITSCSDLLTIY